MKRDHELVAVGDVTFVRNPPSTAARAALAIGQELVDHLDG